MASEQEAWAKISRKRTEEALGRLAASLPNGELLLTMSLAGLFDAAAKAIRERDEAIARAEAAEAKLAAGTHLVSVARLAASLPVDEDAVDPIDRSGESRRPITRTAWQRKPITHEWAQLVGRMLCHLRLRPHWRGWSHGEPHVRRDEWVVPLSRPIEPTKGERSLTREEQRAVSEALVRSTELSDFVTMEPTIGDLHPNGCFASAESTPESLPVLRDCWGDGHHMCRTCARYERAPAGYGNGERGDA